MCRRSQRARIPVRLAVLVVTACTAAACGNAAAGGAPSGSGPAAQVARTWEAFFSTAGSPEQKADLLQDGAQFYDVIVNVQPSSLPEQAHAEVSRVIVLGDTADVVYTVYRGSVPELTNVTGRAVLVDGSWKVSDVSFCQLLRLGTIPPPKCAPLLGPSAVLAVPPPVPPAVTTGAGALGIAGSPAPTSAALGSAVPTPPRYGTPTPTPNVYGTPTPTPNVFGTPSPGG